MGSVGRGHLTMSDVPQSELADLLITQNIVYLGSNDVLVDMLKTASEGHNAAEICCRKSVLRVRYCVVQSQL